MARPHVIAGVEPGSHDVTGSADANILRRAARDLLIAHVPFSTDERFWRKLDNIRTELAQNPAYFNGELSWHWKRWAAMTDNALAHEFARQMPDDTELSLLRDRAVVRSAEEIFAERSRVSADSEPPFLRCQRGLLDSVPRRGCATPARLKSRAVSGITRTSRASLASATLRAWRRPLALVHAHVGVEEVAVC